MQRSQQDASRQWNTSRGSPKKRRELQPRNSQRRCRLEVNEQGITAAVEADAKET